MEEEMMEFENEMYSEDIQSQIKDKLARKNYAAVKSPRHSYIICFR